MLLSSALITAAASILGPLKCGLVKKTQPRQRRTGSSGTFGLARTLGLLATLAHCSLLLFPTLRRQVNTEAVCFL